MTHKISATLVRFERLGERYAILQIQPQRELWSHRPGQYTEIQFEEGGNAFSKVYSIASAHHDILDFCIQMNDPQLLEASKNWVPGETKFGIKAAAGNFYIPPYETPVVLIAGGSGVTPLKAIVEDRAASSATVAVGNTLLLYGCADDQEIPFYEELKSLAASSKNKIHVRFFSEHILHRGSSRAEVGRPLSVLNQYVSYESEYLMCGPPPFMEATRAALIKAGISPRQIHQDRY